MKFLLLALLSCICTADDRRSRFVRQWGARGTETTKLGNVPRAHVPPFGKYADSITDSVVTLRHHDERASAFAGRFRFDDAEPHHPIRHRHRMFRSMEPAWPVKKEAVVEGDLVLGGLMMVHEREDSITCGPVMPQGGVQALEAMLYTLDILNERGIVPGVKIGAHILDDCDKDTYGLEMAVDFIKGTYRADAA